MSLERDLRDALRPLRGDPVDDARGVLRELDGVGPPDRPRTPMGLPTGALLVGLLAVGIAVGLAIGAAVGNPFVGAPPPAEQPPTEQPPTEQPPTESPPTESEDPPDPDQPKKPEPMTGEPMLVMAFGKIDIVEPKKSRETIEPGGWRVVPGTLFETGDSLAGIYLYANDAAIRLDRDSVAAVENDHIALRTGRAWLSTVGRPTPFRIDCELATVLGDGVELIVDRAANGLSVTVLDGTATVRSSGGESRRIAAGERGLVDGTGMLTAVEPVPFFGTLTGWMAPMVLQQQDDSELYARIAELADAYVEGSWRDAAAVELRRFGARAVPRLFETLDRVIDEPELVRRTAELIGDLADYPRRDWLFAMLERGDAETRAIAFRALVRVGGEQVEDESFWRAGTEAERATQSRRWRELLR